jgi:hypothetical protein
VLMCHAFLDVHRIIAQGLLDMAADDRIMDLLTPVADWSDYDMFEMILEHSTSREEFFALCNNMHFLQHDTSMLMQRAYRAAAKIPKHVAHARGKAKKASIQAGGPPAEEESLENTKNIIARNLPTQVPYSETMESPITTPDEESERRQRNETKNSPIYAPGEALKEQDKEWNETRDIPISLPGEELEIQPMKMTQATVKVKVQHASEERERHFNKPRMVSPRPPTAKPLALFCSPPALVQPPMQHPVKNPVDPRAGPPADTQVPFPHSPPLQPTPTSPPSSEQSLLDSDVAAQPTPTSPPSSEQSLLDSDVAAMPSALLHRQRPTSPLPREEPFNMEVVWFSVNAQGALLTTMFSNVYSVTSRHLEWVALAFTNQLQKRDQSPLTLKSAFKIIYELELPITKSACRKLLLRLRDASCRRRGIPSPDGGGWSPTGKATSRWSNITSAKMIQSQKDILAREYLRNSRIDFRDVFVEALFRIALKDVVQDPQVALLAFFDMYRFKDRQYILRLLQYNMDHSPWKHYSNNTLQYLPSSSCASLGRFSTTEYFESMPY